jgi:hypothetical protein
MMHVRRLLRRTAVVVAVLAVSCSRGDDNAPPVATPSVVLATQAAAIGSPIDMRYRFVVAPDAPPFNEDFWVFVHFLDTDGELMWTDDHEPSPPVRQWKPGTTVEYPRTMFIPKFPYVGQTRVEVGLFSPSSGERLPLMGQSRGQRSYEVANFDMRLQSDNLFVIFQDGWHATEVAGEGSGLEWQWSRKDSTLTFANPKRDVELFLQLDQPVAASVSPQQVDVKAGTQVVDTFALPAGRMELRRIKLPAAQLGTGDTVELTISVDRTFVPATVPALKSNDPRELGVRVFRAFVQPI